MATATAPARAAKKAATKPTATKKVAAKKSPTRTMAVKKAVTAKKSPSKVMLHGEAAKNRHFRVDRELFEATVDRCEENGTNISDVMRLGIDLYGKKAPAPEAVSDGLQVLPRASLAFLKKSFTAGESAVAYEFLAACHRQGWTLQSLANSLVAAGVVKSISRQAVSLRLLKVPEELSDDLPRVPELGPRRVMTSPRKGKTADQFAASSKKAKRMHAASTYDLAFRVADSAYEPAARRAKHEHAMMARVLDEIMKEYLSGAYDRKLGKSASAVKSAPAKAAATKVAPVKKKTAAKKAVAAKR